MDHEKVGRIVKEVFEKAKNECVSHSKNALSNHVADEIEEKKYGRISYMTIKRAFERYLFEEINRGKPSKETIDLFCKYLGFTNYKDFIDEKEKKVLIRKDDAERVEAGGKGEEGSRYFPPVYVLIQFIAVMEGILFFILLVCFFCFRSEYQCCTNRIRPVYSE
ncbi:hypothetical protein ACFSTE_21030 [Aquimarina hainanensis]|uniref:HTH araC/xylS-type domain-containing protein n=1 Tax=Aquimarina hainanensis TaxID=1578017 RepID=A0ABW5NGH5_9FLAO|nr:hypothetical protein [Aquimarina sp. TRL1]QKX05518.1 hypothetical protein HN014_11525 [Aquimarina sp. TRL1]